MHALRAAAVAVLAMLFAGGGVDHAQSSGAPAAQNTPPPFRSSVELIPVDVQVVDAAGQPVTGLTPDKFKVAIDDRSRRVTTIDYVDFTKQSVRNTGTGTSPAVPAPAAVENRLVVLAIDSSSIDVSVAKPMMAAAEHFVDQLQPTDQVGLFTYPNGPKVDPTTDHAAVVAALKKVITRRDEPLGHFQLTASEIVDLNRPIPSTTRQNQLCGAGAVTADPSCLTQLMFDSRDAAMFYESMAQASIGVLRSLFAELARVDARKTFVLVSGGMVSTDVPGGRPDLADLSIQIGKAAAAANVSVYSLFVDEILRRQQSAERSRPNSSQDDLFREAQLNRSWLDQFAGAAGGSAVRIVNGEGGPAFNRVLSETSAYYLLGVEPGPEERDGRIHDLKVSVAGRATTVRSRSWVVVAKPGTSPMASANVSTANVPVVPPPTSEVVALAQAFDRDDDAEMAKALANQNASNLIRSFRTSVSPWPAANRRTAAFALDVALRALRSESAVTRDEAVRLLVEYSVRVRTPERNDPFECLWLGTAAASLEGLFNPAFSVPILQRAADRCSNDPRIRLALAVVLDQELLLAKPRVSFTTLEGDQPAAVKRVLDSYDAAVSPDTKEEAAIRAAWLLARAGRHADGLARLESAAPITTDPQVVYLRALIQGQLARGLGRSDEAVAQFRRALTVWPNAQAARVALLTLLVARGETAEATSLSSAVQHANPAEGDPWWVYWLGDYRAYPELRAKLREAIQ